MQEEGWKMGGKWVVRSGGLQLKRRTRAITAAGAA